mmetsp:Transcript_64435/g.173201  ORF Transcript_64435/g.173201 Transcript_64435/m.173201 type:complete len:97 (+) Transcript_64435:239-529(+)
MACKDDLHRTMQYLCLRRDTSQACSQSGVEFGLSTHSIKLVAKCMISSDEKYMVEESVKSRTPRSWERCDPWIRGFFKIIQCPTYCNSVELDVVQL